MRIGNFQFEPALWPSILVIALLPVLIGLGVWQLGRAEQKQEILQKQQDKLHQPPLLIDAQVRDFDQLRDRRLRVRGVFEPKYQVLIDNRIFNGTAGYEVITPLQIKDSERYILVNRGWIPLGKSRENLPTIETPQGEVNLSGLARFDTKNVMGSSNRIGRSWPALVRWADIAELRASTGLDLLPFVLLLDEHAAHGFQRDWKFVNSPPEKNLSYAVQWFALATALLIIYIVVNTKRLKRENGHE